jgi:hypothetical protein
MARMRTPLVALTLLALAAPRAAAAPMSDGERTRLLAHLDMTESWLSSELDGLTPAQLRYRSAPDAWSIMDVVEHLAIAEPQYWQNLRDSLAGPVVPNYKPEATDAGIMWYGIDRSHRAKTGDARVPHSKYADVKDSLGDLRKLRATMREYARATGDDLRGRPLKDGNMDVYQWFLMISSHSQRHILQIREIKAGAGFPKR